MNIITTKRTNTLNYNAINLMLTFIYNNITLTLNKQHNCTNNIYYTLIPNKKIIMYTSTFGLRPLFVIMYF